MAPKTINLDVNQEDLKPVGSIAPECNELKKQYDACFNNWFGKFLKGDQDMSVCDPLLKLYTACVKEAIKLRNIPVDDFECPKFKQHKRNK